MRKSELLLNPMWTLLKKKVLEHVTGTAKDRMGKLSRVQPPGEQIPGQL